MSDDLLFKIESMCVRFKSELGNECGALLFASEPNNNNNDDVVPACSAIRPAVRLMVGYKKDEDGDWSRVAAMDLTHEQCTALADALLDAASSLREGEMGYREIRE